MQCHLIIGLQLLMKEVDFRMFFKIFLFVDLRLLNDQSD